MPLVFTQNEATVEGHTYADVLGQSYEYPAIYRNRIVTGERFVYYRGRRTAAGAARPQVYLGTGVVGAIAAVADGSGRLVCAVEDFRRFPTPVPFKDGDVYREPGANAFTGSQTGVYFRPGVRVIDEETFDAIVAAGWGDVDVSEPLPPAISNGYASYEDQLAVDDVAMELAKARARDRWPHARVVPMHHNNPGFDLRIVHGGAPEEYVEVKGTRQSVPAFFLSEGERSFAERHAGRYHFWVFFAIDLAARSGVVATHRGALIAPDVTLVPKQWKGTLAVPEQDG